MDVQNNKKKQKEFLATGRYEEMYELCLKEAIEDDAESMLALGKCALLLNPHSNSAARYFECAADAGLAQAMYKLGQCYAHGFGVEMNYEKAQELYLRAGHEGYTPALIEAAEHCVCDMTFENIDYAAAFELYVQAALAGDSDAQLQAALFCERGIGTDTDPENAFKWCVKSMENGCIIAMYTLGRYYEMGVGTQPDPINAALYYETAAEDKNPQALAILHMKNPDRPITKTATAYESAYKRAYNALVELYGEDIVKGSYISAANGDVQAMVIRAMLADALKHQSVHSQAEAFQYFDRAARAGSVESLWYIANYYLTGRYVNRNESEAVRLFTKAYEMGHIPSAWELGFCCEMGIGTAKDEARALKLYELAADADFTPAKVTLAGLYETGTLVEADYEKAAELYAEVNTKKRIDEPWAELYTQIQNDFSSVTQYRIYRYEEIRGDVPDRYFGAYKILAQEGDVYAMLHLSDMYRRNTDSLVLLEKAFGMCLKASEAGFTPAKKKLEELCREYPTAAAKYYESQGDDHNPERAFSYYLTAAQSGDTIAMQSVQRCYADGCGTERDISEAYKWECRSRASGHGTDAVYEWHYPDVIAEDKCAEYYRAQGGKASALYALGVCLETGYGVEKNIEEAASLYQQSAQMDYRWAHYALARCYSQGLGMEENRTKSDECYLNALIQEDPLAINYFSGNIEKLEPTAVADNPSLQCIAGICAEKGYGTQRATEDAYSYYFDASARNCPTAIFLLGRCYEKAQGVQCDRKKAFELYAEAAKAHSAAAICAIGDLFERGEGTAKSIANAIKWYKVASDIPYNYATYKLGKCLLEIDPERAKIYLKLAADAENAEAQAALGQCYEQNGDMQNALSMYNRAAENASVEACLSLGRYYMKSEAEDAHDKATKYLQRAADKSNPEALLELADCYAHGICTQKDPVQAVTLYTLAADLGNVEAEYLLGSCYERGFGTRTDHESALKYYLMASEGGYDDAQYALGLCYAKGKGTAQNMSMAVYWYKCAAEKGNNKAQTSLGMCYENGQGGLSVDMQKAFELYVSAAEQGNYIAQYRVGQCYEKGRPVTADPEEAVKWYKLSAQEGNKMAQMRLGECYENGYGIEKNMKAAVELYKSAADNSLGEAAAKLGICYEYGYGVEMNKKTAENWNRRAQLLGYRKNNDKYGSKRRFISKRDKISDGE